MSKKKRLNLREKENHSNILEQLTERTLGSWRSFGKKLDRHNFNLWYFFEGERAVIHDELVSILAEEKRHSKKINKWARIIDLEYSNQPLSAKGSLSYIGQRFNIGEELGAFRFESFPAFYIASDVQTAEAERFKQPKEASGVPASPYGSSYSTILLEGELFGLFDLVIASLKGVYFILLFTKPTATFFSPFNNPSTA